jgi:hypothetical protein
MSFDIDDDVRRDESDELHGIDRVWFDTDPTPAQGIGRPLPAPGLSELASLVRNSQGVTS